jgi:hypothetical protein
MLPSAEHAVFVLREVLLRSRMSAARILKKSLADVDQILDRAKHRIQHEQGAGLLLLKDQTRQAPTEGMLNPLARASYGRGNSTD